MAPRNDIVAMIRLDYKFDNHSARQALDNLRQLGGNLIAVARDIGEYLVGATKSRFAEEKGPDGDQWEENREATLAAYARRRAGSTVGRQGEGSGAGRNRSC